MQDRTRLNPDGLTALNTMSVMQLKGTVKKNKPSMKPVSKTFNWKLLAGEYRYQEMRDERRTMNYVRECIAYFRVLARIS